MKCPICKNDYHGMPDPRLINTEYRNKKIRDIAEAMRGEQKKVILARIAQWLAEMHAGISERHIERILDI